MPVNETKRRRSILLLCSLLPVIAFLAVYKLDDFDPAPLPPDALAAAPLKVPIRMLTRAELVGSGRLDKPEDIAYDPQSGVIYTGCADGWIKRVRVNDSAVEEWINTGGRPLGLAFGPHRELIVADAFKGLLKISEDGRSVKVLTDEADGVKLMLTDGVDVADDGVIYFTDASYKYSLHDSMFDFLEGKPNGRLLSYDPTTEATSVLLSNLYYPNGVSVSPHQDHLVFCETPIRRCSKYYIEGEKKGNVEIFIQGLPGVPDNIKYDGEGHYWIAFPMGVTKTWEVVMRRPTVRKMIGMGCKYGLRLQGWKKGGILEVDLEGKAVAYYYYYYYSSYSLSLLSSALKIGHHLYCGNLFHSHFLRFNLHPPI